MVLQDFVFLGVPTKCLQFQIKVAVTAEVASSSLVVPAIHSKELVFISAKPLRTQKGRAARPCRVPFALFPLVTWRQLLTSLHLRIQERRKRRPTRVLRPVLHASQG